MKFKLDGDKPPKNNCFYCDKNLDNTFKINKYNNNIICDDCFSNIQTPYKPKIKGDITLSMINKDILNQDTNPITVNSDSDSDSSSDSEDDLEPPSTPPHIPYVPSAPPPLKKKKIFMVMFNRGSGEHDKNDEYEDNDKNKHIKTGKKDNKKDEKNKKGKDEKKKDEKKNEEDEDDNHDDNHNCCDNHNSDDDDPNLFFNSLINCLSNIDNMKNGNFGSYPPRKKTSSGVNTTTEDEQEDDSSLEYEWLGAEIKDIDDLIRIGQSYNPKKRKRHNLNLKMLNSLVGPLTDLKNMIGMTDVKKIIFDQIIYYLQKLDDKNVDMLHTVIVGPPGVGKTQLTHIIAKIYNKLGFLKTDKVICAKRDDLIAEYVGQTAPKTRKVLEKALGGVLLLDEVYSLSPTSDRDFAKEAIDMINMYLSEHCHDMVCVVAGYKKPTYEKFMAQNEGLARRFTHHFEIKGYSAEELSLIFKKYVEEQKWSIGEPLEVLIPIIEKNIKMFPNFGGDMTTLFACCKKTHSRRLLLIPTEKELLETKKKLKIADIEAGIVLFKEIKEKNSSAEEEDKEKYQHMYS